MRDKEIYLEWDKDYGPIWPKGFLWHIKIPSELQGSLIPRWYLGLGFYNWGTEAGHYFVIPLNLLVAFGRWSWYGLRFAWARALTVPEKWR